RVLLAVERRAGAGRDALQQLLDVVVDLRELARRQRLENERTDARGLEPAPDVECDGGGREREEPVPRRLLQLLAAEQDVAETHYDFEPGSISFAWSPGAT